MFKDSYDWLISCALVAMFVTLVGACACFINHYTSDWVIISTVIWTTLAIASLWATYRSPVTGFLLSCFCIITVIRISGINSDDMIYLPAVAALSFMIVNFFFIAYQNTKYGKNIAGRDYYIGAPTANYEWHLTFVRLYLGYDLIAHAGEKLFAGSAPYLADVHAFTHLGVHDPHLFVLIAGLCELGGTISIGLGFFTRLGAVCTFIYILVATVLGHHFSIGFIWGTPGGGWEFPVLWMVLILSFVVLGAGKYSIDARLKARYRLPKLLG